MRNKDQNGDDNIYVCCIIDLKIGMGKRSSEAEEKIGLLNDCEFITIERGSNSG